MFDGIIIWTIIIVFLMIRSNCPIFYIDKYCHFSRMVPIFYWLDTTCLSHYFINGLSCVTYQSKYNVTGKKNQIFLFIFPALTSYLLQHLNIVIYKPLKTIWTSSFSKYIKENPEGKPNRINFYTLIDPAFIKSFSTQNIVSSL